MPVEVEDEVVQFLCKACYWDRENPDDQCLSCGSSKKCTINVI